MQGQQNIKNLSVLFIQLLPLDYQIARATFAVCLTNSVEQVQ